MGYRRAGLRDLATVRKWARSARREGPRALAALAALGIGLAGTALGARATTDAQEPTKQFADRVVTLAHQELAGLYVTGLEAGGDELSWGVSSLPCKRQAFRLLASEAAISNTYSSSREVQLTITDERLPRPLRCGSSLPQDVHEGKATVSVLRAGASGANRRPLSVYEDSETKISSFVDCITLAETCPGRYVLRAYLNTPRRHVSLEYAFTVALVARKTTARPARAFAMGTARPACAFARRSVRAGAGAAVFEQWPIA